MAVSLLITLFTILSISCLISISLVQSQQHFSFERAGDINIFRIHFPIPEVLSFTLNQFPLEFSPKSPHYNPTLTHCQRMTNVLRRSSHFVTSITSQSTIIPKGKVQYFSIVPEDAPMSWIKPVVDGIIPGKFAQCLLPLQNSNSSESGKLYFGSKAVVSGPGAVSTPLVQNQPEEFYFVTLEAISVNNKRIEFPGSSFGNQEGKGNIFLDGRSTVLTILPQAFQAKLLAEVIGSIDLTPIVDLHVDRQLHDLDLCYRSKTDFDFVVPEITVHFAGGADVKLDPRNSFFRLNDELVCFSFQGDDSGFAIYGLLAQNNFLVGIDTVKHTVSFKKTDCAKE